MNYRFPEAWLHTLHMGAGQRTSRLTFSEENPFGIRGRDYDVGYVVVTVPLYSREGFRRWLARTVLSVGTK